MTSRGAPAVRGGVRRVFGVECRKLSAQLSMRVLALVCALGPFAFAGVLRVQSGSPSDTLYGIWIHSSGSALSLVLLAFAGSWGLPVIAGIVAGDLFSSEDRHGTWKLVLTRSASRRQLFAGKVLAGAAFSLGLLALAALASVLAGLLAAGAHPLVSLNGTPMSAGHALALVAASWLLCAFPTLAFASLGVMLSALTRNGIAGVIGPALCALGMQLLALVGSGVVVHLLLVATAFASWHALFTDHPFLGPLVIGIAVSALWGAAALAVAWRALRTRDFAGAPTGPRSGWRIPAQAFAAAVIVIVALALAGSWGPTGVTAGRLTASLTPAFNNLTLLQQRELGRPVAPGTKLDIVLPSCSRRGALARGPGDWICTINVLIPTTSSLPPQPTPVTYDVSVQSDGCYKAQSPPAFIGQQLMRDARGREVVNPLYTIYGCFNVL